MVRRLGLVLACLLGCGDNHTPPPVDLVGELAVEPVSSLPSDKVRAIAIAALGDRELVVARATTQGADFCPECLDPGSSDCGATCRRAVLEVTRRSVDGGSGLSHRLGEVFPRTPDHEVRALEVVVLDDAHVGVAWLECDDAPCGAARTRQSCTAHYAAIDLHTGHAGPIATLYEHWYGDLQLAFDPRTRRLLAVVGTQAASGAGVRAAIYDELGATQLLPWEPYGGAAARAPAAAASASGFVIVAEDPAPEAAATDEPCATACDCVAPGGPALATGGLHAFWPGLGRPAERIAPGRGVDGEYLAREAIAAVEAGGRVIVASSQGPRGSAELFEPVVGGWLRRHSSRAPMPRWLGVLGDAGRLAWLGSEPDPGAPDAQRLVAGVVLIGQLEQRGELGLLPSGFVQQVAPAAADGAVTTTFLLRAIAAGPIGAPPERFDVLAVRAAW